MIKIQKRVESRRIAISMSAVLFHCLYFATFYIRVYVAYCIYLSLCH